MVVTLISLDGVPGAGKSKLLREIEHILKNTTTIRTRTQTQVQPIQTIRKIICLQEPVDEWSKLKDTTGETLFNKYYKNQKRYALAFQLQVLHTRFELLEKTITSNPNAIIITERDIVSDCHIFTQMLFDNGMFEEIEFKLYKQLFYDYYARLQKLCPETAYRIYLTTSAEKCYERMQKRGRVEEKDVPLDYLKQVEKYHRRAFSQTTNILHIDGDADWAENELPANITEQIRMFISI